MNPSLRAPSLKEGRRSIGGNVVGVWLASFQDPIFGPGQTQMVIQENGAFSKQWIYWDGTTISISGTWRFLPELSLLRLDTLNAVPISALVSESDFISMPDNNTMIVTYQNCNPVTQVCRLDFVRQA